MDIGMNPAELLLIALSLAVDCFAVAVSASVANRHFSRGLMFRLAVAFGGAQFAMNAAGWFAGRTVVEFIQQYDHWVAFGLLSIVAGRMLWEFFRNEEGEQKDLSRGMLLFTLAIATSIDALAVGLSFAFLKVDIWVASIAIGVVTFGVVCLGVLIGARVGALTGRWAKLAGALVLLGIGIRILVTHLLGG
jgi:putative Mn2+ efflux pump MntP